VKHRDRLLKATAAGIALLAILTGVAVAQGAVSDKLRTGDTVTVAAGETVSNDLYAVAGTVRIDGTVDGDLVASGGLVDVTGTVTGDVLAAGGRVTISGTVLGDARIAGGLLSIGGSVKQDVLAAGGQLTVMSSGTIGEDLIAGIGQLTIDGTVTGNVLARTGTYTKAGTIGGTEDVTITGRDEVLASITYQRFFSRYLRLAGMSGTLSEVAGELTAVYGLNVVRIPTHRPSIRRFCGVKLFKQAEAKWEATMAVARRQSANGRPVLIATRSVADSERLGTMLAHAGCDHVVLNAHHDGVEAAIVAEAGKPGRITVATNMAGRGTDIKLAAGVAEDGGLHVILTEFYESARIDRQVIGRGGRQGDPSTYEMIVALEDDLFQSFSRPLARALQGLALSGVVGKDLAPPSTALGAAAALPDAPSHAEAPARTRQIPGVRRLRVTAPINGTRSQPLSAIDLRRVREV
jgi:cytoskeletal protein CcmA (bactofilin family)